MTVDKLIECLQKIKEIYPNGGSLPVFDMDGVWVAYPDSEYSIMRVELRDSEARHQREYEHSQTAQKLRDARKHIEEMEKNESFGWGPQNKRSWE